jgi:hypothetical protein
MKFRFIIHVGVYLMGSVAALYTGILCGPSSTFLVVTVAHVLKGKLDDHIVQILQQLFVRALL